MKVGHAQPGQDAAVKLEQKNVGTCGDFGGLKMELKASNDGKIKFTNEFTGLMKVSKSKGSLTYFDSFYSYRILKGSKTL